MSLNDPISDALSKIYNAEKAGKKEVEIFPVSKVLLRILDILRDHHYVGAYKLDETTRGKILHLSLLGRINKCGVIKPRFSATLPEFNKYEKRFLPAIGFGVIIMTTPQGILTLEEARKNHTGGKLLAYCY